MDFVSLLPLVLVVLVFWLLVIRPASKRQRQLRELQGSVGPGDGVMLSSGFYGTVQQVADDRVHVAIADGVVVQVAKGAIASRDAGVPERDPAAEDRPPEDPPTHDGI